MKQFIVAVFLIFVPLLSYSFALDMTIDGVRYRAQSISDYSGIIANGLPDSEITEVTILPTVSMTTGWGTETNDVKHIGGSYTLNGKAYYCDGFADCNNVVTINIPSSIVYLKNGAFAGCSALKNINIQDSRVAAIPDGTFRNCSSLEFIELPSTCSSIGMDAFENCTSLKKLIIPKNVLSIGDRSFLGVKHASIFIHSDYLSDTSFMFNLDKSNVVFCNPSIYDLLLSKPTLNGEWCGDLFDIGSANNYPLIINKSLGSIKFGMHLEENIHIAEIKWNGTPLTPDSNGDYNVENYTGRGKLTVKYSNSENEYTYSLCTLLPDISINDYQTTQTSFNFKIKYATDASTKPSSVGVEVDGLGTFYANDERYVRISGLEPAKEYNVVPFAVYNNASFKGSGRTSYTTQGFNLSISISEIGASYITVAGTYLENGATVEKCGFSFEKNPEVEFDNKAAQILCRLKPDTKYKLYFGIDTESFGRYWVEKEFKTNSIKWSDISSLPLSKTSTRLKATVNCDSLCATGFEWRRIDAPEIVNSTIAECPVINECLQGVLRNLNPDVYYKFRPFYKYDSSNTYYGEWAGIFTGDADTFFDPEVKTFMPYVTENIVNLSGFILAGTDDIKEQGFELRPKNLISRNTNDWSKYSLTGMLMQLSLNVEDGAYEVRAYAETSNNIIYGETIVFTVGEYSSSDELTIGLDDEIILEAFHKSINATNLGGDTIDVAFYLLDLNGKLIDTTKCKICGNHNLIFNDINSGMYIIVCRTYNKFYSTKLLVM